MRSGVQPQKRRRGRISERWAVCGPTVSWIIVGGEAGGGARPMHPDWLRGLRDQVHAAGAKLFVKQIGSNHALWPSVTGKGEDPAQWPADLRVQDFPQ